MRPATLIAIATFALAAPLAAETTTGHGDHAASATGDEIARLYTEANARMHAGMAIEFTGDVDVDFVRGMIPHHEGAVEMARIVLEHGSDPEVRKLAEAVVEAQEAEIAWMKDWLAARGY